MKKQPQRRDDLRWGCKTIPFELTVSRIAF